MRLAWRSLSSAPVPSLLAVLALALGVGANAAIFSALRGMLLSPLPYPEPDRVVQVWTEQTSTVQLYTLLQERLGKVEHLDASNTVSLALVGDDEAWEVSGGSVTSGHFEMLRAVPALGRTVSPEDQVPGAEPVVVLSHGLWQSRFAGDEGVVGRRVQLGDQSHPTRTVVGVMPASHRPLESSWQAFIPLMVDPSDETSWSHNYALRLHARLAPDATMDEASAELRSVATLLEAENPGLLMRDASTARVVRLLDVVVGDLRPQLLLLMGAVALVLLVACANVANLLLARGVARQRELAIRVALGATRARLTLQLLGESALLGVMGGTLGLLLAGWLVDLLGALPVDLPRGDTVQVDGLVLAFSLGLGIACSLLAGLVPALRASGGVPRGALTEGGRSNSGGAARGRLHGGLVMVEVALAVVLVIGAGLLLRSAWQLQRVDPGFRYESLLTLRLNPPPSRYAEGPEITGYYQRVLDRLERVPGVESAGAVSFLPLAGGWMGVAFELDGNVPPPGERPPVAEYYPVSGDFFQTLGVPLLSGRVFEAGDGERPYPIPAVVNAAFVERYLPDTDPLGHRLTGEGREWMRVVGVVGDLRQRQLDANPRPAIYVPHGQEPMPRLYVAVRTSGDPASHLAAVGAAVADVDPLVPVTRFRPMSEVVSRSLARSRLFASLLAGFAVLALVLGAVGIYGVVSYGVGQRTREIGVRMALGASRKAVLEEVLRTGLRPVAVGLLAGLMGAVFAGRLLAGYLYDVQSHDPMTFATVGLGVLVVGIVATLGPARRAARLEPIDALRAE